MRQRPNNQSLKIYSHRPAPCSVVGVYCGGSNATVLSCRRFIAAVLSCQDTRGRFVPPCSVVEAIGKGSCHRARLSAFLEPCGKVVLGCRGNRERFVATVLGCRGGTVFSEQGRHRTGKRLMLGSTTRGHAQLSGQSGKVCATVLGCRGGTVFSERGRHPRFSDSPECSLSRP